jgi:rhodanese-related sulfurtransferase
MRLSIIIGILLLASVIAGGCTQTTTPTQNTYTDITPAEAKMMIDDNPDLIIIDVSPAYADGHLPGAVNYYVGDGSLDEAIPMLDKDATYLVYCHVESASRQGAQKLVDAGFMNVYRLEGEYDAWVEAGYPIEK